MIIPVRIGIFEIIITAPAIASKFREVSLELKSLFDFVNTFS